MPGVWFNDFTMLTLRNVLSLPHLGLSAITEDPPYDREVRWAHVSELADPSPWMLGSEIILTTGLNLIDTDEFCLDYCRRLVNAGIAALGISTGDSLPHAEVPPKLISAADRTDLPLIHIPESTLMQSVVHAVSDSLHEHDKRPLLDSLRHQQQLNAAATAPDGMDQVLTQLHNSRFRDGGVRRATQAGHGVRPAPRAQRGRVPGGHSGAPPRGDAVVALLG